MYGITIGKLAQQANIGIEAIRYYERQGLMPNPPRRPSGYRQYPPEAIDRLRFIRRAKTLGFTLDEIRELLMLRSHSAENREQVREKAREKISEIDRRIADLKRMRGALADLAEACELGADSEPCPILAAMDRSLPEEDP